MALNLNNISRIALGSSIQSSSLPTGSKERQELENLMNIACLAASPDLSIQMEICDFINKTQKSTPRQAIEYIMSHLGTKQEMMALELLDVLAKNCGFPIHFQIATKEFLNELVKRFPETPPNFRSMAQDKVLELIQSWNFGIYEHTSYKQDLIHINDMYKLLTSKGYKFPPLKAENASVFKQPESIKTKEELESEDRQIMSAKLQELLRRQDPQSLQEANDLMKKLAGFYPTANEVYEKQESSGIEKMEQKIQRFQTLVSTSGSSKSELEEIVGFLKSSKGKVEAHINKCVEEGTGESDLERWFKVNDLITSCLAQYETWKGGKIVEQVKPAATGSLIDLDAPAPNLPSDQPKKNVNLMDDLMDLNFSTVPESQPPPKYSSELLPGFPNNLSNVFVPPASNFPPPLAAPPTSSSNEIWMIVNTQVEKLFFQKPPLLVVVKYLPLPTPPFSTLYAQFSFQSREVLEDLVFMISVPKGQVSELGPLSSTRVGPENVWSQLKISGVAGVAKIRWKISFSWNKIACLGQGEFNFE